MAAAADVDQSTLGLRLCYLRNVKGMKYNHKRVYRIYRELELNLRIKPRRPLDEHLFESIDQAQRHHVVVAIQ